MLININFVVGKRTMRPLILHFTERIKWRDVSLPCINCSIKVKLFTTSSHNLIKYSSGSEWTDENFTSDMIKTLKQPKLVLKGFYNLIGEFGKLYNEKKEIYSFGNYTYKCPHAENVVDMLFTFDKKEDLNKFIVNTDKDHYGGYSSASLSVTPTNTGLFTGYISSKLIEDGEAKFAGYATMMSRKNYRSFKRVKLYDWTSYTHLVFKVRGDGRTYFAHFSVQPVYESHQNWVFSYPLFTRGGPYWQVSKIALSDFYFISKGKIADYQPLRVILNRTMMFGLSVRQIEGPFKLEIDYIGLESDNNHRSITPYEQYA